MSKDDMRQDPFAFIVTGNLSQIEASLNELSGVVELSLRKKYEDEMVESKRLTPDIVYDAELTDRTAICMAAEDVEGVEKAVSA